jgi:hypothetical protein
LLPRRTLPSSRTRACRLLLGQVAGVAEPEPDAEQRQREDDEDRTPPSIAGHGRCWMNGSTGTRSALRAASRAVRERRAQAAPTGRKLAPIDDAPIARPRRSASPTGRPEKMPMSARTTVVATAIAAARDVFSIW